jgi:hypothetical protein
MGARSGSVKKMLCHQQIQAGSGIPIPYKVILMTPIKRQTVITAAAARPYKAPMFAARPLARRTARASFGA